MIPVFKPSYDEREINAVAAVLRSGWSGMGPKVEEFEETFAEYIGTRYAVALNSGTAALHLAVKGLVKPGSTIITTPITFISTGHAILYNDCKPAFVDVERDTLNLDPDSIPEDVLHEASAIIPVHFAGQPCDMEKIQSLAVQYDLIIIEDAAHACGASYTCDAATGTEYEKTMTGALGDAGCFSFHAVKNLSCGDGGMVTTDDKALADRLKRLRWLGIDRSTWMRTNGTHSTYAWRYACSEVGWKYHMNDIAAAIGLVQLEKLDEANKKRARLAQRYSDAFYSGHGAIAGIVTTPWVKVGRSSAWHAYVVKARKRDELHKYLNEQGIASSVHYMPLFYFSQYLEADCPVAREVWKEILTLPLYPDMEDAEQDRVINAVKEFYRR